MSEMLKAIRSLSDILTEFDVYVVQSEDKVKYWQKESNLIIRANIQATIEKLTKLANLVNKYKDNPIFADKLANKVYKKLSEYISRLQEVILNCSKRDKNNNVIINNDVLAKLSNQLDQILIIQNNYKRILPRKHWQDAFHTALNVVASESEFKNLEKNKTVLFGQFKLPVHLITHATQNTLLENLKKETFNIKTLNLIIIRGFFYVKVITGN